MAIYLGTNKVSNAGTNGGFMLNGHLLIAKTYTFNLGQTNYSSLTPTTTAQALTLPATTITTSPSTNITCFRIGENYDGTKIDREAHDYVIFSQVKIEYNYGSNNVASTIHGIRFVYSRDNQEGKYRGTVDPSTGFLLSVYSKTASSINYKNLLLYQKANNTYATYASAYGIYGASDASFNMGGTPSKDYINLVCNGFNVRAHDSYCPVASLQAINPTNTIITATWQIYEGDRSSYTNIHDTAYELAANQ